eukprot:gb/GFBE01041350.1/.p1 GENE.gb/GFBE01041350.1/~~gb/GFBE01041350.1/.p1  ORF type:complete len:556 (+),score=75.84 gb/GFBE01041350.1/:1-1668(+)
MYIFGHGESLVAPERSCHAVKQDVQSEVDWFCAGPQILSTTPEPARPLAVQMFPLYAEYLLVPLPRTQVPPAPDRPPPPLHAPKVQTDDVPAPPPPSRDAGEALCEPSRRRELQLERLERLDQPCHSEDEGDASDAEAHEAGRFRWADVLYDSEDEPHGNMEPGPLAPSGLEGRSTPRGSSKSDNSSRHVCVTSRNRFNLRKTKAHDQDQETTDTHIYFRDGKSVLEAAAPIILHQETQTDETRVEVCHRVVCSRYGRQAPDHPVANKAGLPVCQADVAGQQAEVRVSRWRQVPKDGAWSNLRKECHAEALTEKEWLQSPSCVVDRGMDIAETALSDLSFTGSCGSLQVEGSEDCADEHLALELCPDGTTSDGDLHGFTDLPEGRSAETSVSASDEIPANPQTSTSLADKDGLAKGKAFDAGSATCQADGFQACSSQAVSSQEPEDVSSPVTGGSQVEGEEPASLQLACEGEATGTSLSRKRSKKQIRKGQSKSPMDAMPAPPAKETEPSRDPCHQLPRGDVDSLRAWVLAQLTCCVLAALAVYFAVRDTLLRSP